MEIEHKIVSLPIDGTLQAEVEKLGAEGWVMQVPPVAVYHLAREKPGMSGMGRVVINDDLVVIKDKNGKIRKN